MSQENRIVCLIDDKFDMSITVIKGLKLYSEKFVDNSEKQFFLLCHVCTNQEQTDENKMHYQKKVKENNQKNVKYMPLNLDLKNPDYYMRRPEEVFEQIENYLCEEKFWTSVDKNRILYLLDLELQSEGENKLEKSLECLSICLYRALKQSNRKYFLYTSYNDERSILNNWIKSYESKFGEDDVKDEYIMSRADFSPQTFDLDEGKRIFNEFSKKSFYE